MTKKPVEKILEKDITKAIRKYLNEECKIFHWKQFQGLGMVKGVPDIIGIVPVDLDTLKLLGVERVGLFVGIEIKTASGKLSNHQQTFLNTIRVNGGLAIVARSTDDIAHLKDIVDKQKPLP